MQPYRVAETYDPLVGHLVPYEHVAEHIAARIADYRPRARTVLDVACGTGNLTIPLARLGFRVSGLDIAPGMVAIAREKAPDITFSCQDMRAPYPGPPVDAITCFFGALNFLETRDALRETFAAMHGALTPGGVLAFDLFSANRMRALFSGTHATDHGDFYAVTRSTSDGDRITHRVTFFLLGPGGVYRREDELHRLTIHSLALAQKLLTDVGFTDVSAAPFHPHVPAEVLRDVSLVLARKP